MSEYVKHHYVPQFILKNFTDDNNMLYLFDHTRFELSRESKRNVFMIENLYDYDHYEDAKIIEKELSSKIESPMGRIVSKILKEIETGEDKHKSVLSLTRKELIQIKKYLMLQFYRTEGNMTYYLDKNVRDRNETSKYNIAAGESKVDFWKREMKYILDNDWEALQESDMLGVRKMANMLNKGYLGVFVAKSEFIISDIAKVAERIPIKINMEMKDALIDTLRKHPEISPYPDSEEILEKEFKNQSSYVDNFYYFPISPKISLVVFDSSWNMKLAGYSKLDYLKSKLPINRYERPTQEYVNAEKIHNDRSNLPSFKDDKDKFYYKIQYLTDNETIHLNTLMMNEAMRSIAFKTPELIVPSIKRYMCEYHLGTPGIKRNYAGLVQLLSR